MPTTNQQQQTPQPPRKKKPSELYAKYSSLAFQIIAFIAVALLIGWELDRLCHSAFIFKLIFGVLGVIGAMYFMIKEVMNDK
jgi:F0F1-type ATP synthase assembly protein I